MQPHQGRGLWILIIDRELDKSEPAQVFSGGSLMTVLVVLALCWVSCFHGTCEEGQVGLSL